MNKGLKGLDPSCTTALAALNASSLEGPTMKVSSVSLGSL